MALSKSHYSQAIMQLFTCFSATVEKNLIGPKPVYQKNPVNCIYTVVVYLYMKIWLHALHECECSCVCCQCEPAAHNLPPGSTGLHYAVNALFTVLCFPSGTPVRNYLWRMVKCYKKEGLDPHLSLPSGVFPTQAISVFLENHASPTECISYLIF